MLKKRLGIEAIERDGCKRTCFKISSTLIIPESVEKIGSSSFWNCCKLKKVVIPKSVVEIGEWAFTGCDGLEKVNIPEGCKIIERYAFESCKEIKEITIPKSVNFIGARAFRECYKATIILRKHKKNFEFIGDDAFKICKDVKEKTRD